MRKYYLDAAAHLPLSNCALETLLKFLKSPISYGNPNSSSKIGIEAARLIESSRSKIAKLLGCSPNQLFFTRSSTDACRWAIKILIRQAKHLYLSPIEHPACELSAKELLNNCSDDGDGDGDVACSMYVNNEVGIIENFDTVTNFKLIFSDITQAVGKIPIDFNKIDLAAFGAHKFGGPCGVGILYIKDSSLWIEHGTGSRYSLDCTGTPDCVGIIMTAAALEEAYSTMSSREQNAIAFRDTLESGLLKIGCTIIAKDQDRIPHITYCKLNGAFGNLNGLMLQEILGNSGIYVGLGSACGSLDNYSKIAKFFGYDPESGDYLRFSQWGDYGELDARYIIKKLKSIQASNAKKEKSTDQIL